MRKRVEIVYFILLEAGEWRVILFFDVKNVHILDKCLHLLAVFYIFITTIILYK